MSHSFGGSVFGANVIWNMFTQLSRRSEIAIVTAQRSLSRPQESFGNQRHALRCFFRRSHPRTKFP